MQDEITVKPLVDVLSTQLGERVVMSGEDYVFMTNKSVISQTEVVVALVTQEADKQEQREAKTKQEKLTALANLIVTTQAGNTFDGHDEARSNMLSALREGDNSDETETPFWILADNSKLVPCTYIELEEAHGLAIRAKGAILAGVKDV